MHQGQFITCNKSITVVWDADNKGGYACVGAGNVWEMTVFSDQYCCKLKTAVKYSLLKIKRFLKPCKYKQSDAYFENYLYLDLKLIFKIRLWYSANSWITQGSR